MAIPSKTKHRFQHITPYQQGGRNNQHYLLAKGNKEVSRDSKYGLQSQQGTEITEQQIEAVRKVISRYVKKFVEGKHKPWKINIYPHIAKTKKPLEVRMGSGKGSVDKWKGVAKVGTVIIELSGKIPKDIAYKVLKQVSHKLPKNKPESNGKAKAKYKIIERNE